VEFFAAPPYGRSGSYTHCIPDSSDTLAIVLNTQIMSQGHRVGTEPLRKSLLSYCQFFKMVQCLFVPRLPQPLVVMNTYCYAYDPLFVAELT